MAFSSNYLEFLGIVVLYRFTFLKFCKFKCLYKGASHSLVLHSILNVSFMHRKSAHSFMHLLPCSKDESSTCKLSVLRRA